MSGGSSRWLADTAEEAGRVAGGLIGLAIGVALLVWGIVRLNRGVHGNAKVWSIVAVVAGALLLLGGLGSAAGGGSS